MAFGFGGWLWSGWPLGFGSWHVRLVCILTMALLLDSPEAAPYAVESTMVFLNFSREVGAMFHLFVMIY